MKNFEISSLINILFTSRLNSFVTLWSLIGGKIITVSITVSVKTETF